MHVRNYGQNCSVAHACDLLGERWTLLIVRDLLVAPRRFSELEKRLKGIGTNLLSKRLRDMRAAGLLNDSPNDPRYTLSAKGFGLEPLILNLAKWSLSWVEQSSDPGNVHYPDWDLLALKAHFRPDRKENVRILVRFSHEHWVAWVEVDGGACIFGLGEPLRTPDVNFPCMVSSLRDSRAILENLAQEEWDAAEKFLSFFPIAASRR